MSTPPLRITPRSLDELSEVLCRPATARVDDVAVLILSYHGTYRSGSQGAADARRMRAEALAALATWGAEAVVFDLRELAYPWGDNLLGVFDIGPPDGEPPLAVVVVAGERSRAGLAALCSPDHLFDDLELAVHAAGARARAHRAERDRVEDALVLPVLLRDDLPPARAAEAAALAAIVAREHFYDRWEMRLWVAGDYRLAVLLATAEDLDHALSERPAAAVKDPARGFERVGVVLSPRAELPARLLDLSRKPA